jgi:proteic killer suppression protein
LPTVGHIAGDTTFFRRRQESPAPIAKAARLRRLLTSLNSSTGPAGMNLAGYRLRRLRGDREAQWAVSVSGDWRLEFEDEDAANVDLVYY